MTVVEIIQTDKSFSPSVKLFIFFINQISAYTVKLGLWMLYVLTVIKSIEQRQTDFRYNILCLLRST